MSTENPGGEELVQSFILERALESRYYAQRWIGVNQQLGNSPATTERKSRGKGIPKYVAQYGQIPIGKTVEALRAEARAVSVDETIDDLEKAVRVGVISLYLSQAKDDEGATFWSNAAMHTTRGFFVNNARENFVRVIDISGTDWENLVCLGHLLFDFGDREKVDYLFQHFYTMRPFHVRPNGVKDVLNYALPTLTQESMTDDQLTKLITSEGEELLEIDDNPRALFMMGYIGGVQCTSAETVVFKGKKLMLEPYHISAILEGQKARERESGRRISKETASIYKSLSAMLHPESLTNEAYGNVYSVLLARLTFHLPGGLTVAKDLLKDENLSWERKREILELLFATDAWDFRLGEALETSYETEEERMIALEELVKLFNHSWKPITPANFSLYTDEVF